MGTATSLSFDSAVTGVTVRRLLNEARYLSASGPNWSDKTLVRAEFLLSVKIFEVVASEAEMVMEPSVRKLAVKQRTVTRTADKIITAESAKTKILTSDFLMSLQSNDNVNSVSLFVISYS